MKKYLDFLTPKELIAVRKYLRDSACNNQMGFRLIRSFITEDRVRELSNIFIISDSGSGKFSDLKVSMPIAVKNMILEELFDAVRFKVPKHILAGAEFTDTELKELCLLRSGNNWNTWFNKSHFESDCRLSIEKMDELVERKLAERKSMDDCTRYRLLTYWKSEFEEYIRNIYLSEDMLNSIYDWYDN